MSAQTILGHFLVHFKWFFVKTARNRKIFAENCDYFVILNSFVAF